MALMHPGSALGGGEPPGRPRWGSWATHFDRSSLRLCRWVWH